MDSKYVLRSLIKRKYYDLLLGNLNLLMIAVGIVCAIIGTVYILVTSFNFPMLMVDLGFLLCMLICLWIWRLKIISRAQLSRIMAFYTYFILTPVVWFFGGNLSVIAPYLIILIIVINLIMLSGKVRRKYFFFFMVMVTSFSLHSCLATRNREMLELMIVEKSIFLVVTFLIAWILLYSLKRYDEIIGVNIDKFIKDDLTGMLGRRVLKTIIEYLETQYIRQNRDYVLVMIDVNNFKRFNDHYGHVAGDVMLKNIAACIIENTRPTDFVVRYGGDEILVLLPSTTMKKAKAIIERALEVVKKLSLFNFEASFSYGAAVRSECKDSKELISLADKRMYMGKETEKYQAGLSKEE
ncbi:MAG: GGDEF domain-containing protein [Desulfitobacteriia bacterium]